ncbi:MAG: LD-carboxypeptidase [Armatimonadetes bacterium]|nr:LD-carboxypeptidase [Armatimonadota bacterium]
MAPSSPVPPAKLAAGIATLERWGYRVVVAPHVLDRRGHLAGRDEDRVADLREMFARPDIQGIFCARGGCGCIRLLPHLDFAALAQTPKVFVGYSDVTLLHTALNRAGLVTFFGPMVSVELARPLPPVAEQCLRSLVTEPAPLGLLADPERPAQAVVPGHAVGPLAGGTLSLLCQSLGTPWEFHAPGCLLFLEDVHEPLYRVDRMLTHLKLAGKLDAAAGFVIGRLHDADLDAEPPLPLSAVLADHLADLGKPVAIGLPVGHVPGTLTLPLGVRAELDVTPTSVTLRVREPAVAERGCPN